MFAAHPRRWQWPQQHLAVGVCCVCKATLFPQPPPPALRESKQRQTKAKVPAGAEYTRFVGCAELLLLPKTATLSHRAAGEATRVLRRVSKDVATMHVLRLRPPPWQQCVGVFRQEIKNSDSLRDELLYGNVISWGSWKRESLTQQLSRTSRRCRNIIRAIRETGQWSIIAEGHRDRQQTEKSTELLPQPLMGKAGSEEEGTRLPGSSWHLWPLGLMKNRRNKT